MLLALPKGIPTLQTPAGNWTTPDNVWRNNTPDNPIVCCNTVPALWPPLADHIPIIMILDLPLPCSLLSKSLDYRTADWLAVNPDLAQHLETESMATPINSTEEFLMKIDNIIHIITETLDKYLDKRKPNLFKHRWWTKELSLLKKKQNRLSGKAFKLCHIWDHPIHTEYRTAMNRFKTVMHKTQEEDWKDWLETILQQDLYIANKYISNEPSNYSSACIPTLHTTINGCPTLAEENSAKVTVLTKSFFPSLTLPHTQLNQTYPPPLCGPCFFPRPRIRQVIKSLSPYKAPGPDAIPNIILMKCIDALIDHLFFIFKAVPDLNTYHPSWLKSTTLVLRKIGKSSYDLANSYHPIGLMNTIPKVLSTLCFKHTSYLTEKYNLLPTSQFGGHPGCNTTDAMHLIVHKIKGAW
jgi:hypothetical protein